MSAVFRLEEFVEIFFNGRLWVFIDENGDSARYILNQVFYISHGDKDGKVANKSARWVAEPCFVELCLEFRGE